ncbi:MAG: amidohydrolase family protein [Smithellaceae bacterium]
MKKQILFLLTIAIIIPLIFGCSRHYLVQPSPDMKNGFLIRHVNVFTAQQDRPVLEDADVYIEGKKIVRISTDRLDIPGAEIIDGKGRMLLPGLIDFHNHIMAGMIIPWDLALLPKMRFNLEAMLYSGVVATVDMNGESVASMRKLSGDIELGQILGPRLFYCGMGFTAKGAHPIPMMEKVKEELPWYMRMLFPEIVIEVNNEEDMAKVDKHLDAEPDFTKIFLDDLPDGSPKMKPEVVQAIVKRSHKKGIPVLIHIGRNEDVKVAIESGADGIAHNVYKEHLDPELARELARRKMIVIPTVYSFYNYNIFFNAKNYTHYSRLERETFPPSRTKALNNPKPFVIDPLDRFLRDVRHKYIRVINPNVKILKDEGVTILAGTDSPNLGIATGGSLHVELAHLVEGGLTPTEALISATSSPARILRDIFHKNIDFGVIEEGKSADLLLVEGNPTKNIRDTENIIAVFYKGNRLERKLH